MIYKANFTANNLKSRLISPVIFGNITKIFFDIFDEERANKEIDRLVKSNTLISDMILRKNLPFKISMVKGKKRALILGEDFNNKSEAQIIKIKPKERTEFTQNLFNKRNQFREYKNTVKKIELENGIPSPRLRNSINRLNGTTIDNKLFLHNEFKYGKNDIFSIYVSTNDKYVIDLMEIVLKILEKVGIGTDTSIGNGIINFKRYNKHILIESDDIELGNEKINCINIASTIINEDILQKYKFKDYRVQRYDSRTPRKVKACYYYIECGSIVKYEKEYKSYIISNPKQKIKTYTCVFPVKFKGVDTNERS